MASLKESSPEVYEEFVKGNWVMNKNPGVSCIKLMSGVTANVRR